MSKMRVRVTSRGWFWHFAWVDAPGLVRDCWVGPYVDAVALQRAVADA
jgi:hypothetical protein